jgi:transposase-like protein
MPGRKPTISDDEIIAAIRDHQDPILSTKEVSEQIGIGRDGTLKRLHQLKEEARVDNRMVGDSYAWYITD